MTAEDNISKEIGYSKKECIDMAYKTGQEDFADEVLKAIDKDIEYQESKLTRSFLADKPLKWRIIGMNYLKQEIFRLINSQQTKQSGCMSNDTMKRKVVPEIDKPADKNTQDKIGCGRELFTMDSGCFCGRDGYCHECEKKKATTLIGIGSPLKFVPECEKKTKLINKGEKNG